MQIIYNCTLELNGLYFIYNRLLLPFCYICLHTSYYQ
nr:MAG TPA: hypothetical protein [Caudoviricetes sp.]